MYVAGIHVFNAVESKTWMAGTSPAMTGYRFDFNSSRDSRQCGSLRWLVRASMAPRNLRLCRDKEFWNFTACAKGIEKTAEFQPC
jgi:hypothetical protein